MPSLKQLTETRRRPVTDRKKYSETEGLNEPGGLMVLPVEDVEEFRNKGISHIRTLMQQGWYRPENTELLDESPDGVCFNLVRPYDDVMAERQKKNDVALALAGKKARKVGSTEKFVQSITVTEEDTEFEKVVHNG